MGCEGGWACLKCVFYFIFFPPIFLLLFFLSLAKVAIFSPFVLLVIAFGVTGVVVGLWPYHLVWTTYCIARTQKFGPFLKCVLIPLIPIPIALWTVVGVLGSVAMGVWYGFFWPVSETFRAISKEGVSIPMRILKCVVDGTWSNVWGACTTIRDFGDFSFHSYSSFMDELLKAKGEKPIEIEVVKLLGSILSAIVGVVVDVPSISLIVLYKAPILLFKGWHRFLEDLIGREGPFLETACVPLAGFLILLWPAVVLLAIVAGILSSVIFGLYAAVVAYQENSTKRGLLYTIAAISLFDESTNDFLYLREGSCFPRPRYRESMGSASSLLLVKGLDEGLDVLRAKEPLIRTSSEIKALSALVIWDNFFIACNQIGKKLLASGAIGMPELEEWLISQNKIVNIGIPAYTFLECFLRSIKCGSRGFVMSDNVEITSLNRPEGKVFDWLFEPMCIMKEQLKSLDLVESEELYLCKFCLYSGDPVRIEAWRNGGFPPQDEVRRAQLEGIGRRLQGFCLMLSRLPTSRRRFFEVVKEIELEAKRQSNSLGDGGNLEVSVEY